MKIKLILGLVISFVLCSCSKDENLDIDQITTQTISKKAKALSDFYGGYSIADKYKKNFFHIWQYDNSETSSYKSWPGGLSYPGNCSWCNYIMATGCVGRASGRIAKDDYKLDKARRLKVYMKTSSSNTTQTYLEGATMEYIYNDYGVPCDNSSRVGLSFRPLGKAKAYHNTIALEMLTHLEKFKTPIVMIGSEYGEGHYYTIVAIEWYGSLTNSKVWVANSLKESHGEDFEGLKKIGAIHSINFKEFLNAMSNGPDKRYTRCNLLFTYDLG